MSFFKCDTAFSISDPEIVHIGGEGTSSLLTWPSNDADSVRIEPDIGSVDLNGSLTVTPMQTTTYTLTATGLGGTRAADVTVTVYNPVTLKITSPLDDANVTGRTLSVKGTVSHAGNLETGVTVNGILAMMDGNLFTANHVPLAHGENIITARATDVSGVVMTDSITVNADTSGEYITISADPVSGMAPFETTLQIEASFNFTSSNIS